MSCQWKMKFMRRSPHKKLNAWKALCNQEASFNSLSLVSIHYNESQANLPLDDDDVHFQRWLLELLSASISPMIMAAIKYSSGIERRGTRVIIKTIYLLQIPIKIQEVVFVSFYYKAPPHSGWKSLIKSHFTTLWAKQATFTMYYFNPFLAWKFKYILEN